MNNDNAWDFLGPIAEQLAGRIHRAVVGPKKKRRCIDYEESRAAIAGLMALRGGKVGYSIGIGTLNEALWILKEMRSDEEFVTNWREPGLFLAENAREIAQVQRLIRITRRELAARRRRRRGPRRRRRGPRPGAATRQRRAA